MDKERYMNEMRKNLKVDNAVGLEQTLTTLTQIVDGVQRQKFYTLLGQSLTDFVPIEMGKGAYSQQLFQYQVANVGDSFESGVIAPGNGINKDANVDILVDGASIKNNFWRQKYTVTKEILEMGRVNAETFSYIEELETARLKTYQLGIQKVVFNGYGESKGLLNQTNVSVNTDLLPANLKSLTVAEIHNFVKNVIDTYLANNNTTVLPNRWLMPTADFVALGAQFNPEFPIKTTKAVIEEAFKEVTGDNFKIVHAKYCDNAGTTGARHVFYNYDSDSLTMYLPKPYTPHPLYPVNALDLVSDAEAQFTGVWAKRPKEMLYLDVTPATT